MTTLIDRHANKIAGVISCFDRVVISGTIPGICHSQGMTDYLYYLGVRIFDYTKWAAPLREEVRDNAARVAKDNGLEIQHVRTNKLSKESIVAKIVKERGEHPGLVHILSAMERCPSFEPWHDKRTHKTFLRYKEAKCLHYYFYFIDPEWGLCYLRVSTWAPFRLQFYFNGHNWLAAKLREAGVGFQMCDNAFVNIEDFEVAQSLASKIDIDRLHGFLDRQARKLCPVIRHFHHDYHWSLMQVEYATDIVFKRQSDLEAIYEELVRTAIHSVKPENIATFLGRKLHGNYRDEMGNDFSTRLEGTRIKHHMGKVAIKMYDKFNLVVRIETTANDVSFFKHYRKVEQRGGASITKNAKMKKHIYSLAALIDLMGASNRRYIDFISAIDDPTCNLKDLDQVSRRAKAGGRSYRGFNFFHGDDAHLLRTLLRGEFTISGFRNVDLRPHLPGKSVHQISRLLKCLRKHGLIKKIGRTYKYYLTKLGRRVAAMALKLKEMYIIPSLRGVLVNHEQM